jgi:hypothetical protein
MDLAVDLTVERLTKLIHAMRRMSKLIAEKILTLAWLPFGLNS